MLHATYPQISFGYTYLGPTSYRVPGPRPLFWKASTRNGCQAPGHSFGKAPLKMGKRPQGILPGDQKQSRNNPEKPRKSQKISKKNFNEKNEKCLFLAARMPLLKVDAH